jgi:hypothetical protein
MEGTVSFIGGPLGCAKRRAFRMGASLQHRIAVAIAKNIDRWVCRVKAATRMTAVVIGIKDAKC